MFVAAFAGADAYKTAVVNGTEIYLVNVASRIDADGQRLTSIEQFRSGADLHGNKDTLINGFGAHDPIPSNWEITGLNGGNTGGFVIDLGQVYNVSQVWTHYAAGTIGWTIEVSTDNDSWTQVNVSSTGRLDGAGANDYFHVFANAQEAQFIKMTATSAENGSSAKVAEISVYTAPSANPEIVAPQRNSGYDMGRELFANGGPASIMFDGVLEERGSGGLVIGQNEKVIIDLGELELINRLCITTSFIDEGDRNSTFDAVSIALSADGETWHYLIPDVSLRPDGERLSGLYACGLSAACDELGVAEGAIHLRTGAYAFDAVAARYVMFVNYGDDYADHKNSVKTIRQLQIYSVGVVPEPATMTLLTLGGLALLRRRK